MIQILLALVAALFSSFSAPKVTKVQLLIYKPVAVNGWNDPQALTGQIIADLKDLSGGRVTYQIAETKTFDYFPEKADGFNYTQDAYLACLANAATCHQPDAVNYRKLLAENQSCEKRNRGEIDEVWLWGGPYFGYWEAVMAGPGAFNTNAPPLGGTSCRKSLHVMGFNYERGISEVLEDFGHRMEGTLAHYLPADWANFKAQCGWMHYAPNSVTDYDWSNLRTVISSCATGRPEPINCSVWQCDGYEYKKWWFRHLPKDWWRYFI
jgi:hypothetical protein